jgi:hypothetical protein
MTPLDKIPNVCIVWFLIAFITTFFHYANSVSVDKMSNYQTAPKSDRNGSADKSLKAYLNQPLDDLPIRGAEEAISSLKLMLDDGELHINEASQSDNIVAHWIKRQIVSRADATGKKSSLMEFRLLYEWIEERVSKSQNNGQDSNTDMTRFDNSALEMLSIFIMNAVELGPQSHSERQELYQGYDKLSDLMSKANVPVTFSADDYTSFCEIPPV